MLFVGRQEELEQLRRLQRLKKAALVVIKGRRRIGKSTLVAEFAKGKRFIALSGIPPSSGSSAQKQRDAFAEQLCLQLGLPRCTFVTWLEAFHFLASRLTDKETVVLFDEISWMGDSDPDFLGLLKTWWDQYGSQLSHLVLVLCGSISSWIEKNLLRSTGFVGRITLVIHLQPLSLPECARLLRAKGFHGSAYELFKILSVTGGVPWYLDLIDPKDTADANIRELCFRPTGQLVNECRTIFHDLFDTKGEVYRKLLHLLIDGMKTQQQLREDLGYHVGGTVSEYLHDLVAAGFVSEHYQWALRRATVGRQKLYRLSDCFIRFQLKYVEPNQERIKQGNFKLPGWDSIMGFQLESLLLTNRQLLFQALGLDPALVVCDNPFIQRPSTRTRGCQIDYLIQTSLHSLILCEFKFCRDELRPSLIGELQAKCQALSVPRGYGKTVALFHIGGVTPAVAESPLFYRIVDLGELLGG